MAVQGGAPKSWSEARDKGVKHYFTGKPCHRGHYSERLSSNGNCIKCAREKARRKYINNPIPFREATLRYYYKNREKVLERERAYAQKNKERRALVYRRSRQKHAARVQANARCYEAEKAKRTPAWADLDLIYKFYECCPAGCHVDHIVPLRGEKVSGLHVPENLQWLPASENIRKGNKWPY